MKVLQYLFDKLIVPILVAILSPIAVSLYSKLSTGDWLKVFEVIPSWTYICVIVLIVCWIIIIFVRRRIASISDSGGGLLFVSIPAYGWVTIGQIKYCDVIWRLRYPAPSPWDDFDIKKLKINQIEAETPPRCPECETELEEKKSFWGGYIWECVGCGYKKRNKYSYYREDDRVNKIARREWERQKS